MHLEKYYVCRKRRIMFLEGKEVSLGGAELETTPEFYVYLATEHNRY